MPGSELGDEHCVWKGSIYEHPLEGDPFDIRPFQVAPLLLGMRDRVDSFGWSGDRHETCEVDIEGPIDHTKRVGIDASGWPLALCVDIASCPHELPVRHEVVDVTLRDASIRFPVLVVSERDPDERLLATRRPMPVMQRIQQQ